MSKPVTSPGSVSDNHLALLSVLFLLGIAFVASGVASHSDNGRTAIILILLGSTFFLTLNLGLYDGDAKSSQLIMELPWNPSVATS